MVKLISIELKKILYHKSIYFIYLIIFIFCLFNNILYSNDYDDDGNYKYDNLSNIEEDIGSYEEELISYDINNDSDKNMYLTIKTKLDILNIVKDYSSNSWQYIKADEYLYTAVYNVNYYTYIDKNEELLGDANKEYDKLLKYFYDDNYQYFLELEREELLKREKENNNMIDKTEDKEELIELEEEKRDIYYDLKVLNYRLNKNISYSNTYLNRALVEYQANIKLLEGYSSDDLEYDEILEYNSLKTTTYIDKYIVDNRVNVNKENNLNYQLRNIATDYELFIVIIILITTSILIGEEFNKDTIKNLLVKPYRRRTILLSKFLASLIMIILTVIFIVIIQLLLGGIIFGLDSLSYKIPVYNLNINKIQVYNVFNYMLLKIITKLPMFIIIQIISFMLGILISNTIATFSITMLLYTFSAVINNLIFQSKIKLLGYFITLNWNFQDYLFGNLSTLEILNLKKSILIYLIYVIILLGVMFISFSKKNIKNI